MGISDIEAKVGGKPYQLRYDYNALALLERRVGESYVLIFSRLGGVPLMSDVFECFAAMSLPYGELTAQEVAARHGMKDGLKECIEAVKDCIAAGNPPATPEAPQTAGGKGEKPDPQ